MKFTEIISFLDSTYETITEDEYQQAEKELGSLELYAVHHIIDSAIGDQIFSVTDLLSDNIYYINLKYKNYNNSYKMISLDSSLNQVEVKQIEFDEEVS